MRTLIAVALLLALDGVPAASAPDAPAIKVKGRSLARVDLDAGRAEGLKVGDRLRVITGQTTVAEIQIVHVDEHTAYCKVVSLTRPIGIGDVAVPVARASGPPAPAPHAREAVAAAPPTGPPTPSVASKTEPAATAAPPATPKAAAVAAPSPVAQAPPAPTSTPPAAVSKAPAVAASSTVTPPPHAPIASSPVAHAAPSPSSGPLALAALAPRASSASPQAPTADAPAASAAASPAATDSKKPPSPPAPASRRGFKVKYRSAANVYLDAGRAEGLNIGDRLRVVAGQATVAELEVVYVAELSASCKVLSETRPVRAGDVAVPLAGVATTPATGAGDAERAPSARGVAVSPAVTAAAPERPASGKRPRGPWAHVRGGASLGYYRSWDTTTSALDFEQRTARLDLGLYDIAGQPLSFTLRGRSRQDVRARALSTRTPKDERTDRVYELALRYEPLSDRFGVEAGRIGIHRFVGIGYLDGALARFRPRPGIQLGAFGGRQADVDGLDVAGTVQKYGGFVRLAPAGRYAIGGYDVLLAYVRENAEGDVSREYLSLESSFGNGSRWSLFQRAELDFNRGWRQEMSGTSYQFSNLSLSGNLRLARSSWAFLSYDGRRNYRYYRNRLVPAEIFDDLLHQGLRAGLNVAKPGGFGASAGFGMSLKEPDPRHPELNIANAYSFNAGVRHANLFSSGVSVGLDGSGFTNGYADGGLLSARLGWRFGPGHLLDVSYGYSLYNVSQTEERRSTQWLRFVGRAELRRRIYLLGDFEYDAGDDLEGPRGFLELGFVF